MLLENQRCHLRIAKQLPLAIFYFALASLTLSICQSDIYAATYAFRFFHNAHAPPVGGQPIVDSFYTNLSENGKTVGYLSFPGQSQQTSIYDPASGHTLLGVSRTDFWVVYRQYRINNAGSVIWNEYDVDNNVVPYLYVNGNVTSPNLGEGHYGLVDINNQGHILGTFNRGTYGDPSFAYGNFLYDGNQVTELPGIDGLDLYPIGMSSTGLALFESYDLVDYNFQGIKLYRAGTSDYVTLESPSAGGNYVGVSSAKVTANGLISAELIDYLVDPNDPYNYQYLSRRLAFYNSDGTVQSTLAIPDNYGQLFVNGLGEVLASTSSGKMAILRNNQWSTLLGTNLPQNATIGEITGFNSDGVIIGTMYGLRGVPSYQSIGFYATEVPEPASLLVFGGLCVFVGAHSLNRSRKRVASGASV